jgi:hypothetical protein
MLMSVLLTDVLRMIVKFGKPSIAYLVNSWAGSIHGISSAIRHQEWKTEPQAIESALPIIGLHCRFVLDWLQMFSQLALSATALSIMR